MIAGSSITNISSSPLTETKFSGPSTTSISVDPTITRKKIEDISKPHQTNVEQGLQQQIKIPRWLLQLSNFSQKGLCTVLNLAGYFGAGLAFLSYFVLNLKSLSLFFGIPTGMSFLISYHLQRSLKDSDSNVTLDPIKGLRDIVHKSGLNQNIEKVTLMRDIAEAKKLLNSPEQGEEAKDLLLALKAMVDSRLYEISRLESSFEEDKDLLEFYYDLESYKDVLDNIEAEKVKQE